jgi:hypothetical protein
MPLSQGSTRRVPSSLVLTLAYLITMLQWSVIAERPSSPTTIEYVTQRPWRQLDIHDFRAALRDSVLCRPNVWHDDVDQLANLYDSTLNELFDRHTVPSVH